MIGGTQAARAAIEELARSNPDSRRLARACCLATTIDRPLLRLTRRLLVPDSDASAEVDLWVSDLVARRDYDQISLDRDVRALLAGEFLAGDPKGFEQAWAHLEETTRRGLRGVSPSLLVGEELFYLRFVDHEKARDRERAIYGEMEARLELAEVEGDEGVLVWAESVLAGLSTDQRQRAGSLPALVAEQLEIAYRPVARPESETAEVELVDGVAESREETEESTESPETSSGWADDGLSDFTVVSATYDGKTKTVFRLGHGPGVVVMSEIPGITPTVADFARRVAAAGFTVAVPDLFGTPGRRASTLYTLSTLTRACVSREFTCLATGRSSPVTSWLRRLAADLHAECGGPGVGAIGMCLTGGFALAMMVEPAVVAPVLSQPSLPFSLGARRRADLGVSEQELAVIKDRVANEPCPVVGLRFTEDPLVPVARFDRLDAELGDGFLRVEIDSSPGNLHGIARSAHSVLTEELVDEDGHPTRAALDLVLDFLGQRLGDESSGPSVTVEKS